MYRTHEQYRQIEDRAFREWLAEKVGPLPQDEAAEVLQGLLGKMNDAEERKKWKEATKDYIPARVSMMEFVRSMPPGEATEVLRGLLSEAEAELGRLWSVRMAILHELSSASGEARTKVLDSAESLKRDADHCQATITRVELALRELTGKRKPRIDADEVRKNLDVYELVRRYVPDAKIIRNKVVCKCPFHGEKTASFTADRTKKVFFCFGCGAKGNMFQFVMEMEGCDFPSALKLLI